MLYLFFVDEQICIFGVISSPAAPSREIVIIVIHRTPEALWFHIFYVKFRDSRIIEFIPFFLHILFGKKIG